MFPVGVGGCLFCLCSLFGWVIAGLVVVVCFCLFVHVCMVVSMFVCLCVLCLCVRVRCSVYDSGCGFCCLFVGCDGSSFRLFAHCVGCLLGCVNLRLVLSVRCGPPV